MGTINTLNGVECGIINAVNNLLAGAGGDILKWDDNTFCPVPTATPTPTPTPTPGVNCVDGETTNGGFYSFYDCCGVYFEGSGELPFVACYDANKLNTGISFGDPCSYSCVTPTPTITPTMTPTPTPVPCDRGCCFVELCFAREDCSKACTCNDVIGVYLNQPCNQDPCELAYADGIYKNDGCTDPAEEGYYSDNTNCYLWQSGILTIQGTC
jgi:hypothetical protein